MKRKATSQPADNNADQNKKLRPVAEGLEPSDAKNSTKSDAAMVDEKESTPSVSIYARSCIKVKPLEFFTNKPEVLVQELLDWRDSDKLFDLREGVVRKDASKEDGKAQKTDDMEDVESEAAAAVVEAGDKVIFTAVGAKLSVKQVHELMEQSTPSLVGKGKDTVFDPSVRKSIEIGANRITLAPEFEQVINKQVEAMRAKLMHPQQLQARLHKLIVYRPGDYFRDHMDAVHEPNMVASLSVELLAETDKDEEELYTDTQGRNYKRPKNAGLNVEDMHVTAPTADKPISVALFWHDCYHNVEADSKYHVKLIFDVLQVGKLDEKMLAPFRPAVQDALAILRATGAPRAAVMLSRRYLGKQLPKSSQLKGPDRILAELLREQGCASRVHSLFSHNVEYGEKPGVLTGEVFDLIRSSDAWRELYHIVDSEDAHLAVRKSDGDAKDDSAADAGKQRELPEPEDDYGGGFGFFGRRQKPKPTNKCKLPLFVMKPDQKFEVAADESGRGVCIKPEFLLGDVLFVDAGVMRKSHYGGGEEVHLGNQGFSGHVFDSVGLVFTL